MSTEGGQAAVDREHEKFDIVALPMDTYVDKQRFPDLATRAEADEVVKLLQRWGGVKLPWESPGRTLGDIQERLRAWSRARPPHNSMLLWLGHGESNQDRAVLAVRGEGRDGQDDVVTPEVLADHIARQFHGRARGGQWAMVVVEACGASLFIDHVLSELLPRRAAERILLVGSGADQGSGYLAAFRHALAAVLDEYNDNYAYIRLLDLAQRLQEQLGDGGRVRLELIGDARLVRSLGHAGPVSMTLEDWSRPRLVSEAPLRYVSDPAAVTERQVPAGELSWLFVGRAADRGAIGRWLAAAPHGVLAVAGRPGCGKSALVGDLLLHSRLRADPGHSAVGLRHDDWPADIPPPPLVDASLNLTGASVRRVIAELAPAFGIGVPDESAHDDAWALALLDGMGRLGGRRVTLVADALDASLDPGRLASLLSSLGAVPGVRVVVATRPSVRGGLDAPDDGAEELLDALGQGEGSLTVHRLHRDPQDLAVFVRSQLTADRGRFADLVADLDDAVGRVAELVCAQPGPGVDRDFLYASLAVHEIIADPGLLREVRRKELALLLGGDHRRLFGAAVTRLEGARPGSQAVLRALALARGRGMPRAERVWGAAASALAGMSVDTALLESVAEAAAPYILLDADDGQAVFRLAHHAFGEYLLGGMTEDAVAAAQLRITEGLVALAGERPTGVWSAPEPHPYLLRYLAEHAAAAGSPGWLALAERPDVLDRLDAASVTAAALRSPGGLGSLPSAVKATLVSAHVAARASPADRRGLRQLGAWRTTGQPPGEPLRPPGGPPPAWEVRWASLAPHPPHLTLAALPHPLRAVTVWQPGDGRCLVIAAGDAGTLRAWDLATGAEVFDGPRAVDAVGTQHALLALPIPGGSEWLAAAGEDRVLRLWVPGAGMTTHPLPGDAVTALARLGGALVIGDRQGRVTLVAPDTGCPLGRARTGPPGWIRGMADYPSPDGERLASVDNRGWVHLWRQDARRPIAAWDTGAEALYGVAVLSGAEDALLAVAGHDGTVGLWDPARQRLVHRLTGHDGPVLAVTASRRPDGSMLLATAGRDGTVRLWDPGQERPLHYLTGHDGPVHGAAAVADSALLVTAGRDGTVRLWDALGSHSCAERRPGDSPAPARAVALGMDAEGSAALAAAGPDSRIRWYDLENGRRRSGADRECPGPQPVLGTLAAPDGPPRLAAAGSDRIRVQEFGELRLPTTGRLTGSGRVAALTSAEVPPRGTALMVLTDEGEVHGYRPPAPEPVLRTATGLAGPFPAMAALPGGSGTPRLVVAAEDGRALWLCDPLTGKCTPLPGADGADRVCGLAVLPRGVDWLLALLTRDGVLRLLPGAELGGAWTLRLGLRCHALAALRADGLAVGTAEGALVLAVPAEAPPGSDEVAAAAGRIPVVGSR